MSGIVVSTMLGLSSFFVGSIADEVLSKPHHHETPPAAYLVMALYLAICQFWWRERAAAGCAPNGPQ
jgi:hypothetical protein